MRHYLLAMATALCLRACDKSSDTNLDMGTLDATVQDAYVFDAGFDTTLDSKLPDVAADMPADTRRPDRVLDAARDVGSDIHDLDARVADQVVPDGQADVVADLELPDVPILDARVPDAPMPDAGIPILERGIFGNPQLLVYQAGPADNVSIYTILANGQENEVLVQAQQGESLVLPVPSFNGQIAYLRLSNEPTQIWSVDEDGNTLLRYQLEENEEVVGSVRWNHEGTNLAFLVQSERGDIQLYELGENDRVNQVRQSQGTTHFAYAPDNDHLLFRIPPLLYERIGDNTVLVPQRDVEAVNTATHVALRANGSSILFVRGSLEDEQARQIWKTGREDLFEEAFTLSPRDNGTYTDVLHSHIDRRAGYFTRVNGEVSAVYSIELTQAGRRRGPLKLTNPPGSYSQFSLSPNGERFSVLREFEGQTQIRIGDVIRRRLDDTVIINGEAARWGPSSYTQ